MMYFYDIQNWYWAVEGNATQVYSSAAKAYVPTNDPTYATWLAAGHAPTFAASEAALQQIFSDGYPAGWPTSA